MTEARPHRTGAHVPFIALALGFAIAGGFVLAIVLPVRLALGEGGPRWPAYVQVHGHIQTIGFVGLIIVGVGHRLAAAFSGRPDVRYPQLIPLTLVLIAGGVLLRAIGQPSAAHTPFTVLHVSGAVAEALGAAVFAFNLIATLRGTLRREPAARFFVAGAGWFLVQALLALVWIAEGARSGAVLLPPDRDHLLIFLQLFGFHLVFILGVAVRAFPTFFARPHITVNGIAVPFWGVQAGLTALVAATLIEAGRVPLGNLGLLALAVSTIWITVHIGWWRRPSRIRPASRPFAITVQLALAWLTATCAFLAWTAVIAASQERTPTWLELDVARHTFALGVVLTLIVAMAQLVLPEFASERLSGQQGAWRGPLLGGLLSCATILRIAPRFAADAIDGQAANWLIATSGVLALGVILAFGVLFARGARHHRALRVRFDAFAAGGEVWPVEIRESRSERSS